MTGFLIFIAVTAELVAIVVGDLGYLFNSNYSIEAPSEPWIWSSTLLDGKQQSPIKIDTRRAISLDRTIPRLTLYNYNKLYSFEMQNTGQTVNIKIADEAGRSHHNCQNSDSLKFKTPFITDGPLKDNYYILKSYHFHWGRTNSYGAEHKIDEGPSYPAELHFVHENIKYNDSAEAVKHWDGIAVVAVLIHLSTRDGEGLKPITNNLNNIVEFNSSTLITPPMKPCSLLCDRGRYYTYNGSLTTPPYSEVVTWIVFSPKKCDVTVSNRQLNEFRSIKKSNGENLFENNRDTQDVNGRIVNKAKTSSICCL